jgi:hypothetical protein
VLDTRAALTRSGSGPPVSFNVALVQAARSSYDRFRSRHMRSTAGAGVF